MAVSTPVIAWVSSLLGTLTGVNQSSSLTVTVNITQGWEIQLPIKAQFSNVSNDPVINVYPSSDGGANFDTQAAYSFALAMNTAGTRLQQTTIRLPAGQYAIQILNSGPNSQSFQVLTAQVITAVNIA